MKDMTPDLIQALQNVDIEEETRLGRRRLSFRPELEAAFRNNTSARRRFRFRRTALYGLLVYNLFFVADVMFLPETARLALGLHFFVTAWLAIVAAAMSFPLSPGRAELLAASLPLVIVAQIETVFMVTTSHMADQYQYFVVLVAMFGNAILRLRFRVAAVTSSLVMLTHFATTSFTTSIEPGAAVMSLINLGGSIYITLISNAVQEAEFRRDWLRRHVSEWRAQELSRDNDKLSQLSRIDPLTGIPNRRGFDLAVERCIADAAQQDRAFCVIMLDVDHFKSYNDTYGHGQGDVCLRAVSRIMSEALRPGQDVVGRFGGEEFIAFVPDCHLAEGAALAERIRRALAAAAIVHERRDGGQVVTASLGVAEGRLSGLVALNDTIAHADIALYEAKKNGRNRVEPAGFNRRRPPLEPQAPPAVRAAG